MEASILLVPPHFRSSDNLGAPPPPPHRLASPFPVRGSPDHPPPRRPHGACSRHTGRTPCPDSRRLRSPFGPPPPPAASPADSSPASRQDTQHKHSLSARRGSPPRAGRPRSPPPYGPAAPSPYLPCWAPPWPAARPGPLHPRRGSPALPLALSGAVRGRPTPTRLRLRCPPPSPPVVSPSSSSSSAPPFLRTLPSPPPSISGHRVAAPSREAVQALRWPRTTCPDSDRAAPAQTAHLQPPPPAETLPLTLPCNGQEVGSGARWVT